MPGYKGQNQCWIAMISRPSGSTAFTIKGKKKGKDVVGEITLCAQKLFSGILLTIFSERHSRIQGNNSTKKQWQGFIGPSSFKIVGVKDVLLSANQHWTFLDHSSGGHQTFTAIKAAKKIK